MRTHSRKLLTIGAGLLAFAALGVSLAAASLGNPEAASPAARTIQTAVPGDDDTGRDALVTPVSGKASDLFTSAAVPPAACLSQDSVVNVLTVDAANVGGKTYVLGDGLDQAFADVWRREVDAGSVKVSGIVAHLFEGASGWMADVVEIGADGCAITRTLIPGDQWSAILKSAMGPEV